MRTPALEFRGIRQTTKTRTLLDGFDLQLSQGESIALISDEADSTASLFRLALGIVRPDAGTIRVCGIDPAAEPDRALERIGYLPALPDAPGWMRAKDYFEFIAVHYPEWDEDIAERLGEEWGLPTKTRFRKMHTGHAMRVQLAAILACEPRLLLLDRACAWLTQSGSVPAILSSLAEFRTDGGAILCATRESELIEGLCERSATLVGGRVAEARLDGS